MTNFQNIPQNLTNTQEKEIVLEDEVFPAKAIFISWDELKTLRGLEILDAFIREEICSHGYNRIFLDIMEYDKKIEKRVKNIISHIETICSINSNVFKHQIKSQIVVLKNPDPLDRPQDIQLKKDVMRIGGGFWIRIHIS